MSDSSCIETAAWDLRCRSLLFPVIDEKDDVRYHRVINPPENKHWTQKWGIWKIIVLFKGIIF